MSKKCDKVNLLPVLLNGKLFTADDQVAINTDGRMILLEDRPKDSRFK